jgi:hypothetical protein
LGFGLREEGKKKKEKRKKKGIVGVSGQWSLVSGH